MNMKLLEALSEKNIKLLYHGTDGDTAQYESGTLFMSTDEEFVIIFGSNTFQCSVNLGNVFNSVSPKHIQLIYKKGFRLRDSYLFKDSDEFEFSEKGINYDWTNNYYPTPKDYLKSPSTQDSWNVMEKTAGLVGWIFRNGFDSIKIFEGGTENYIVKAGNVLRCKQIR